MNVVTEADDILRQIIGKAIDGGGTKLKYFHVLYENEHGSNAYVVELDEIFGSVLAQHIRKYAEDNRGWKT